LINPCAYNLVCIESLCEDESPIDIQIDKNVSLPIDSFVPTEDQSVGFELNIYGPCNILDKDNSLHIDCNTPDKDNSLSIDNNGFVNSKDKDNNFSIGNNGFVDSNKLCLKNSRITFPLVVDKTCVLDKKILFSTPMYMLTRKLCNVYFEFSDYPNDGYSFSFTKLYNDKYFDEPCRSLGEIFDFHRNDELVLVGGVRGGRGRRRGGRCGPKKRMNIRRKRPRRGRGALGVVQPGRFMPNRFFAKLRYDDQQYNRTLTAGVSNWFFQNSPYEPDPTSGTTNIVPGFTDLNAMYNRWKVHRIIMRYTLTVNNTDPIFFCYLAV